MIEIDQELALLTELLVDLIGDPRGPVAHAMHPRLGSESRLSGTVEEFTPRALDTSLKGSTITGRGTAQGMHQAQFGFFPRQRLPAAVVRLRRIRGDDRNHPAVEFRNQPRGAWLGGPRLFQDAGVTDRLGMSLNDLTDRLHRQGDSIMFKQFASGLLKRDIGTKIGHHPLQRLWHTES